MRQFFLKAQTAWRIGLKNIFSVVVYRLALRAGWHPVQRVRASLRLGPYFPAAAPEKTQAAKPLASGEDWIEVLYFGAHRTRLHASSFDWHSNPIDQKKLPEPLRPWWLIPDFNESLGDIKTVWEASRFNWVLPLAQNMWATAGHLPLPKRADFAFGFAGDASLALNSFVSSWVQANPCYQGPNWKCGQESSIRVLNLLLGLEILGRFRLKNERVEEFVAAHLKRIAPTLAYALAQENNHGTSEAAALYIGGIYLAEQNPTARAQANRWAELGWKTLENRSEHLILEDGSFSQYSTNYHRMVIDTYSLADYFRRAHDHRKWNQKTSDRLKKAVLWLTAMVDPVSGVAANLGANDGSQLLQVTGADFRDYRPTLGLAQLLFFSDTKLESEAIVQKSLAFFRGQTALDDWPQNTKAQEFSAGGFVVLRNQDVWCLLRGPRFRFRPSQSDVLHLDVWSQGRNVLGDAGTFTYSADTATLDEFAGPKGHNTVEFDGRLQMPRLSRFLLGAWAHGPQSIQAQSDGPSRSSAEYRDWQGCSHRRVVTLENSKLQIEDSLGGGFQSAIQRWRLPPGEYSVRDHSLTGQGMVLRVRADIPIKRFEIVNAWSSEYYLLKDPIRCLEVEVDRPGTIETKIELS